MPKVNFPEGNVWKEFELKTGLITPPKLKLELKPSFKKDATLALLKEIKIKKEQLESFKKDELPEDFTSQALIPYFDSAVSLAISLVMNWDLIDEDEKAIPCDDKKKKYFLEPLMWESVVPEVKEEDETAELEVEIEDADELPGEEVRKKLDYLFFEIIKFCSNMKNFSKN